MYFTCSHLGKASHQEILEMASRGHMYTGMVSLISYSALLGPVLALCALVTFTLAS